MLRLIKREISYVNDKNSQLWCVKYASRFRYGDITLVRNIVMRKIIKLIVS